MMDSCQLKQPPPALREAVAAAAAAAAADDDETASADYDGRLPGSTSRPTRDWASAILEF